MIQVPWVTHLEGKAQQGNPVATGLHSGREDVDPAVGQGPSHIGQQPVAVQGLDDELHEEDTAGRGRPVDLDDLLAVAEQILGIWAVASMHRDAVAARDKPDDVVAGDRGAAAGQFDPDVGQVAHHNARVTGASWSVAGGSRDRGLGEILARALFPADRSQEPAQHMLG